jgi:hypothetical protein
MLLKKEGKLLLFTVVYKKLVLTRWKGTALHDATGSTVLEAPPVGGMVVTGIGLVGTVVVGEVLAGEDEIFGVVSVGGFAEVEVPGGLQVVVGTWHTWSFGKALTAVTTNTSNVRNLCIAHAKLSAAWDVYF